MVNNQNEFDNEYNNKEITEIKITDEYEFEGYLVIDDYPKLKELYLQDIDSIDKVILKNLPQLQGCTIWDCGIKDLVIKNCSQIKKLNVRSNSLTNLEFLKGLEDLEELEIDGNAELIKMLEPYRKIIQKSNDNVQVLEKEKKDLSTQLELSQQKYNELKKFLRGVLVSLSKNNQEELVNELNTEIETSEKKTLSVYSTEITVIKTAELTSGLRSYIIEELKESREWLKSGLNNSEEKIQELNKKLDEIKDKADERQKKVEELDELVIQTPIYKKTTDFLKARSLFLNIRLVTIEELQKCFNKWDEIGRKNTVVSEIGNTVSNVGGSITDVVTYGIPKVVGEAIIAGSKFSKIVIDKKGNKEFQISLMDEKKELNQLIEVYNSLISLTRGLTRESERKFIDFLDLRLIDGKEELFGKGKKYKIFDILIKDNAWWGKYLSFEKMEVVITSLVDNFNELDSELKERFDKLIDELKVSRKYGDLIIKDRDIQTEIRQLKGNLNELTNSVNNKLRSKRWSAEEKEKRNQEREEMVDNLLNVQIEIIRLGDTSDRKDKIVSLRKELLEIANEHGHKEFETELDKLCQAQIDLTKLKLELERLQKEQQEAQILSPTSPKQFNWNN